MLKRLFTPILIALFISSGTYYFISSQAAQPLEGLTIAPTPTPSTNNTPQAELDIPPPIPPARLPDVDAVVVIDNSGSMFGYTCINRTPRPANDPQNLRVQGAQVVITSLAADLDPRQTSLSIITFGDTITKVRELTRLSNDDPRVRDDLVFSISNPPCQGDTNIAGALQAALDELRSPRATAGNVPTIIFLTDGAPTKGGSFAEIDGLLRNLDEIQLFVVLLGQDAELTASKEFWNNLAARNPQVVVEELQDAAELPELYRNITRRLNQVPDLADEPSLPPSQQVSFSVPPNVRQMVITVLKRASSVPLTIQDPAGGDVRAMPTDRFRSLVSNSPVEAFVVGRPAAGNWTFGVPDGETITVLKPEYKSVYQVELLKPDSAGLLAVDLPTQLLVQVVDVDSKQLIDGSFTLHGSYRLVNEPENIARSFDMTASAVARQFTASLPPGTFAEHNQYLLSFSVEDANKLRSQPSVYQLMAGRIPVIKDFLAPAKHLFVDEPVDLTVVTGNSDATATAAVHLLTLLPSGATPTFSPDDVNTYRATIPALERPGTYTITVSYSGQTISTRDFYDTANLTLNLEERPETIRLRWLALTMFVLTGSFLFFRYVLLPPMMPLFQNLGISPQGYIRRTQPGDEEPDDEEEITLRLRRARKLNSLTIGVGPHFDYPLEPLPDDDQLDDSQNIASPRPALWARLWAYLFGPAPAGYIRRIGKDTVIINSTTGERVICEKNAISKTVIDGTIIEGSLSSMQDFDQPD